MRLAAAVFDSVDCSTAGCPNESDGLDGLCSYCRRYPPPRRELVNVGPTVQRKTEAVEPEVQQAHRKVYLAGPMRGIPLYNFPAFAEAAAALRARGFDVWSPAEADVDQDGFDPAVDEVQPFVHYMRRDLPAVMDADQVVVLPGWQRSTGARLEVYVAEQCGIPVVRYPDLLPARHPSSQAFHSKLELLGRTHDAKNADYGTDRDSLANIRECDSLGVPPFVGCEVRIGDKNARIRSFLTKGELVNESVADSVLDRAVYSVIQLVLLEEQTEVDAR